MGRFVVKRITLVGVEFTLIHTKSGGIRLGNEKDVGDDSLINRISDVITAHGSQSSSLESFAVRDARLGFYDEITGLNLTAPRANMVMRGKSGVIGTSFDADVIISGSKSHVTAELALPPDKGPITGTLAITGLDLRALGANASFFEGVKAFPVVASASTSFRVAADNSLQFAAFDITAHGDIPFGAVKAKVLKISNLRLVGRYEGPRHHLALSTADLEARGLQAQLKGGGRFHL